MRICGIKFGHDGSVAVIEDGRLRFSIELEKIDNQQRHCLLADMEVVFETLAREGLGREAVQLLFNEVFPPDKRIVVTALSNNARALAFWQEVGFDEYCISFHRTPDQQP